MLTFLVCSCYHNNQRKQPNSLISKYEYDYDYSLELLFINVAIGTICCPFSKGEGGGTGLWSRACVFLEI